MATGSAIIAADSLGALDALIAGPVAIVCFIMRIWACNRAAIWDRVLYEEAGPAAAMIAQAKAGCVLRLRPPLCFRCGAQLFHYNRRHAAAIYIYPARPNKMPGTVTAHKVTLAINYPAIWAIQNRVTQIALPLSPFTPEHA